MEQLPPELIIKIVAYLIEDTHDARKSVKELYKFFATCQQWNNFNPQSILKCLAVEFHPHMAYSNDKNINWRVILNAISSAYHYYGCQNTDAVGVARELVEHGTLFPEYDPPQYVTTPMITMSIEDQRKQIREYLKKIPNINMMYIQYNNTRGTILFHLCQNTSLLDEFTYQDVLLEELLAAGADPNIPAIEGDYKPHYDLIHYRLGWPLVHAAYNARFSVVERLLKVDGIAVDVVGGADLLWHKCSGQLAPIHAACVMDVIYSDEISLQVIKSLLERVGSCSQLYAFSISPHFCLNYYNNPLAFKRDQNNVTALHLACVRRHPDNGKNGCKPDLDAIRLLFDYGADVNAQTTPDGFTPLHMLFTVVYDELTQKQSRNEKLTIGFDLRAVVKFLVQEQNTDLLLKNSSDKTVLEYATMVQNIIDVSQSILDLLI